MRVRDRRPRVQDAAASVIAANAEASNTVGAEWEHRAAHPGHELEERRTVRHEKRLSQAKQLPT